SARLCFWAISRLSSICFTFFGPPTCADEIPRYRLKPAIAARSRVLYPWRMTAFCRIMGIRSSGAWRVDGYPYLLLLACAAWGLRRAGLELPGRSPISDEL